ncbi:MAG: hypothetical protein KatS3mg002_0343 [Candidatus Woesearchaeota archaeon]|nr:MAG: hypothetical protein KatS3mg002_0343 [Candidatus Woesearchaeota archaeon]
MKQIDFIFNSGTYSLIVNEDIDKDNPELMNLFLQTKVTRISFNNSTVIINPTKLIAIAIKDVEEFSDNELNDDNEENILEEEIIIDESLSENMINNMDDEINQNDLDIEDNTIDNEDENQNSVNNEIIARIE